MNNMAKLRGWAVIGPLVVAQGDLATAAMAPPDLVLLNGKVLTVDAKDTIAEAIAVRGGRIIAVGRSAEVAKLATSATRRIDLKGRAVTPGLIDTHAHLASGGIADTLYINLSPSRAKNLADVQRLVKSRVQAAKPGEWVRGQGWDESKLTELRYIYARDLDPVSPDNPVYLTHTTGHYGVANSAALKLAGITNDTPDPPGGTIDRAPDGTPTGVLKELAQNLIRKHVPVETPEQWDRAIAVTSQGFANECITAVKEPGIFQPQWDAYKRAQADGKLRVRIFALWRSPWTVAEGRELVARIQSTTRPYVSTGDDHLISGGIKIAIDGSGGARTAWMHEDWNKNFTEKDVGNKGYPVLDPAIMTELVRIYHNAGLHMGIHSIGDRGIDWTVDAYDAVLNAKPTKHLRHTIIHANVPTDAAIEKMARLQKTYDAGYPEAQGPFVWWLGDTYAGNLGPERSQRLKPFKTFVDRGVIFANGSDYPIAPYPGRLGLWASVDRSTLLGIYGSRPAGTANSVDIHTTLRSYTAWAAHTLFLEKKVGTIEVGKYADLAVWDKDLYAVPASELKDMKCSMTLMNGNIVHNASPR
jgi:predicted amidohydrolase YtcJ